MFLYIYIYTHIFLGYRNVACALFVCFLLVLCLIADKSSRKQGKIKSRAFEGHMVFSIIFHEGFLFNGGGLLLTLH